MQQYVFLSISLACLTYLFIQPIDFTINNQKQSIILESLKKNTTTNLIYILKEEDCEQWVLTLPHATVINEGGILTAEGYILEDTATSTYPDQHRICTPLRNLNDENPLFFKGTLAVISSPGSENWYHWLLQVLPRLIILKQSKLHYDKIYINNLQYKWQKESLEIVLDFLNINSNELLIIQGDCILQADNLLVPSIPLLPEKYWGVFPIWLKNYLHTIFLKDKKSIYSTKKNIYISRSKASCRRIINEAELIEFLKQQNFDIVYLEDLHPYDQARIFNNAHIIIGAHGSGFANLIFAQPGSILIEIDHGTNPVRSYYKTMSRVMQVTYKPFYVDHTTDDHLEDDMIIDIATFKAHLDSI